MSGLGLEISVPEKQAPEKQAPEKLAIGSPAGSPSFGRPRFTNSKKTASAGAGSPGLGVEAVSPLVKDPIKEIEKEIEIKEAKNWPVIFSKALEDNNLDQALEAIFELEKDNIKFYLLTSFNTRIRQLARENSPENLDLLLRKLILDKPWSIEALQKVLKIVLRETAVKDKAFQDPEKLKKALKALNLLLIAPYYRPEIWLDQGLVDEFKKHRRESWRDICIKSCLEESDDEALLNYSGLEVFLDIEAYKPKPMTAHVGRSPSKLGAPKYASSAIGFLCGDGVFPSQNWAAFPEQFKDGRMVKNVSDAKELLQTRGLGKEGFLAAIHQQLAALKKSTIENMMAYARSGVLESASPENLERLRQVKLAKIKFKEIPDVVDFEQLLLLKNGGAKHAIALAIESQNSQAVLEFLNLFDLGSKWLNRITRPEWTAIFLIGLKDKNAELVKAVFDKVKAGIADNQDFKNHLEDLIKRKDREGLEFINIFAPELVCREMIEAVMRETLEMSLPFLDRSISGESLIVEIAGIIGDSPNSSLASASSVSMGSSLGSPAASSSPEALCFSSMKSLTQMGGWPEALLPSSQPRSSGGLVRSQSSFVLGSAALAGLGSVGKDSEVAVSGSDSGALDPDEIGLAL